MENHKILKFFIYDIFVGIQNKLVERISGNIISLNSFLHHYPLLWNVLIMAVKRSANKLCRLKFCASPLIYTGLYFRGEIQTRGKSTLRLERMFASAPVTRAFGSCGLALFPLTTANYTEHSQSLLSQTSLVIVRGNIFPSALKSEAWMLL